MGAGSWERRDARAPLPSHCCRRRRPHLFTIAPPSLSSTQTRQSNKTTRALCTPSCSCAAMGMREAATGPPSPGDAVDDTTPGGRKLRAPAKTPPLLPKPIRPPTPTTLPTAKPSKTPTLSANVCWPCAAHPICTAPRATWRRGLQALAAAAFGARAAACSPPRSSSSRASSRSRRLRRTLPPLLAHATRSSKQSRSASAR